MKADMIIFPAIDLRRGKVVRLKQGDPGRETVFSEDPAAAAQRWISAGARWLHVVNLDGAFGEEDTENQAALAAILRVSGPARVKVQMGGGLRSLEAVGGALGLGVERAILGTAAVEDPDLLQAAIDTWGAERIGASLDARGGMARVRGWQAGVERAALDLAREFSAAGLRWLIYTDIARDGLEAGVNVDETVRIAHESSLQVIASGGVRDVEDIRRVREAGLAGVIVGKALYSGRMGVEGLFKGDLV
jgi:phosphoribosylformimino-5-aminoimidazole carboxamide ribotide isomerase